MSVSVLSAYQRCLREQQLKDMKDMKGRKRV